MNRTLLLGLFISTIIYWVTTGNLLGSIIGTLILFVIMHFPTKGLTNSQ